MHQSRNDIKRDCRSPLIQNSYGSRVVEAQAKQAFHIHLLEARHRVTLRSNRARNVFRYSASEQRVNGRSGGHFLPILAPFRRSHPIRFAMPDALMRPAANVAAGTSEEGGRAGG
jgi:hypothetical protein